jgi:type I restriction enzyme S subunit
MSALPLRAVGEVVETVSSWAPERDDPDGVFTYVDLSAVDQDAKVVSGARELPCSEAPSRARQLIRAGDVLVSTVRPNLNGVAHVPTELDGATASTGFCVLRPRPTQLDGLYLYQWVKSPRFVSDMVRKATGASYPAVSDRIVCESKLPLPPLPEQRRIAEILDKADALRAKRRAALAQLDTLTQSIFLDMFGDPATNSKGWPRLKLQDLFDIARGGSPRPIDDFITDAEDGINWIMIGDAPEGAKYITGTKKRIKPEGARRSRAVKPGDFLLTNSMSFGRPYIMRTSGCIHDGWLVLSPRANASSASPDYFYSLLRSRALFAEFSRRAPGATVKNLNIDLVRSVVVPVPPTETQKDYAQVIAAIERAAAPFKTSLDSFDALFAALQHRAFRGEL